MIEVTSFASGSRGNCYRVTDGRTPLLLECGISINDILRNLKFGVSSLAGCLVSHGHNDHSKAVKDLMKFGVDIYLSQGTAEEITGLGPWRHRINIIKAKQQFRIGTWTILPFETQHDAAEPLGFLLANQAGDKLLYATDTYYIRYRFSGLTHIMVECNYAADILKTNVKAGLVEPALKTRILKSHFSLENVKKFLLANDLSKVEAIFLLHLSDGNSDAERFKREIQELTGRMVFIA
jgi:phosphoribosyl 1,2-cyclic phosphodiesterase